MKTLLSRPELTLNYSILNLRIKLASILSMGEVAWPEYRFEVECRLWHPTGAFTYSVSDLCFEVDSFERFSHEIRNVQQGKRRDAALSNVGDMMVLPVEGDSRKFLAAHNVREYLVPTMASLQAKFELDYDIVVNRLPGDLDRFVAEIRLIDPVELV